MINVKNKNFFIKRISGVDSNRSCEENYVETNDHYNYRYYDDKYCSDRTYTTRAYVLRRRKEVIIFCSFKYLLANTLCE